MNNIESLPQLNDLPLLDYLNLSYNKLTELPKIKFEKLTKFLASNNKIRFIGPESFSLTRDLETLDLSNNDIAAVPLEIGNLFKLTHLNLYGNRFKFPRQAVLQRGTEYVLQYLRDAK
jgi:Leucine-rich repeat (LRR) protein